MQDTIIEKEHPSLDIIDKLFGRADEYLLSRLISNWRDEVWKEAVELLEEPSAEIRDKMITKLEIKVNDRGRYITGY